MTELRFKGVDKTFVRHLHGAATLPVLRGATLDVRARECVVLTGSSGTGKSTLLKLAYGNYRADSGTIIVRHGDDVAKMSAGDPREVLGARRRLIGYVSQFLSVIPRIGALNLVAAAAKEAGHDAPADRACEILERLRLPKSLWSLPPATFSGGERQRVNIAIGMIGRHPVLLLDEPTASLDSANRDTVVALVNEKREAGAAILAIFHDEAVRKAVATRTIDVATFAPPHTAAL
ncbi:MAG: phosphonate C-P lyase system protein PhnL [Pseudomonadota bacterium]